MTLLVVENEPPVTFLRRKMTGGRFSMGVVIRRYTGLPNFFNEKNKAETRWTRSNLQVAWNAKQVVNQLRGILNQVNLTNLLTYPEDLSPIRHVRDFCPLINVLNLPRP